MSRLPRNITSQLSFDKYKLLATLCQIKTISLFIKVFSLIKHVGRLLTLRVRLVTYLAPAVGSGYFGFSAFRHVFALG